MTMTHLGVQKIATVASLSALVVSVSIFYHLQGIDYVFSHLYWLPVVLAVIWWGMRGWFYTIGLAMTLPVVNVLSGAALPLTSSILRFVTIAVLSFMIAWSLEERRKAEKITEESEEKYSGFFKTSGDCVFIVSDQGEVLEINHACRSMFGLEDKDDHAKTNPFDLCIDQQAKKRHFKMLRTQGFSKDFELDFKTKDGETVNTLVSTVARKDKQGRMIGFQGSIKDITVIREAEGHRDKLIGDLRVALDRIDEMEGMLSICASCKRIRDDEGGWREIEEYVSDHSKAEFSHGICPDCMRRLYPDYDK